jgi:hypothetical protein
MPIIIDGYKFYGFIDHDYRSLLALKEQDRIEWFEYRYKKILFNPIRNIRAITIDKKMKPLLESDEVSIYTIVLMSICVGIDLLAGFFAGAERDAVRSDFISFVDEYLDQNNEYDKCRYKPKDKFSELLYFQLRCGLAHNLAIKKVGFTYGRKYFVFSKKDKAYYVSVERLFEDFQQVFAEYLKDVKKNPSLMAKFNRRFNYVFIKGL